MNFGHSSRLPYDDGVYEDKIRESTSELQYRLSPDQIYNCGQCLSTLGPRGSHHSGVSRVRPTGYAASQDLIDVDSVLSNRNVPRSKLKSLGVNPDDVTKHKLVHARVCNNKLNPESTRLSYPASNYRDMPINRFYNLPKDPQANIFWDAAVDTRLEAIDNFKPDIPVPWSDRAQPVEKQEQYTSCQTTCSSSTGNVKICPSSWKNKQKK